jgi:hypothetical protein
VNWPSLSYRKTNAQLIAECRTLTAEGQTYFGQVLANYELLAPAATLTPAETQIRKIADDIEKKKPEERTWADLFELEISFIKLQPELDLRRGAWAMRTKYRDIAGEKAYDAYQASNPPDAKTGNLDELRADTEQILGEFHWIYAFTPVREQIRNSLAKVVFFITLILVFVAFAIAAYGYFSKAGHDGSGSSPLSVPALPIIIALGMIGGYVSLQQRIQTVPSTGDPIVNIAELSNSRFSVYLAPISGAVFATLLYIIFIGGLLKGPLFPIISTPQGTCESSLANPKAASETSQTPPTDNQQEKPDCLRIVNFSDFVTNTGPSSGIQFAVLLVWSFIAGFAERFVPDTLDRLISQAAKN